MDHSAAGQFRVYPGKAHSSMTTVETRIGRLEAFRETHADDIRAIKDDIKTIDGKLDVLIAAKGAASWLTKGLMPALWTIATASAVAAVAHGWH